MIINCTAVIFPFSFTLYFILRPPLKALFVAFTCFCFLLFYLFLDVIKCPFLSTTYKTVPSPRRILKSHSDAQF